MTNRQKLIETNMYDLLYNINKNLLNEAPYGACIMQGLDVDYNCTYNCGECIAQWLNEEAK